jgi:hypothetical protein
MFDFTTILTLIAPPAIAPLGCLATLKAIKRAELRRTAHGRAPIEVVLDRTATSVEVVLECSAAAAAAEDVRSRRVA